MKKLGLAVVGLFAAAAYAQTFAPPPPPGTPPPPPGSAPAAQAQFKPEELEALVAPIALYPDALLAQVLMASTYPLEIVEAARWSKENPGLKDQTLQDALLKQTWDPSVKSLASFPTVLQMMSDKLDMTQKLGDAFLAQQQDVMKAVQRLRAKAYAAGNLKSGKELTYTSQKDGDETIIVVEPTQPDVVYVPSYNTTVVYGPWPYPMYPPYYYPPPPGYAPGGIFFGFTVGIIIGGMWGGCNWRGGGNVYINNVNNYNRINHTNISNGNWQHSPEHRKGVGYRDPGSRDKFGQGQRPGADTRDAFRGRAEAGQRDIARGGAENFGGGRSGAGAGAGAGSGAFDGVGRGGESRSASDRGAASRGGFSGGSAAAGGGGFQGGGRGMSGGGFHGGGGRGGGGRR
jgi:hypothetical protein